MSHEIRADYGKQWLLPPSLEDWVGGDHPARFIREVVDAMDLAEMGFRQRKSDEGRPSYAADLLLKVWLYGYFEKIRSSRGMERACLNNIGMLWLTGMHCPDKNTLWRFWKDNKTVVKKVYRSVLEMAMEAQLIGLVLHAVDGTKIPSKISGKRALHEGQLKKILNRIEKSVEEVMEETERAEQQDEGEYRLPVALQDRERLRKEVKAKLEQLKQQGRQHWLEQDPEARFMKIGSGLQFGYNGQVVVDAQSGLIVAEAVVDEESDKRQLVPMVAQVEENLGQVAEETVADGGYVSVEQLRQAEDNDYPVLVNLNLPCEDSAPYHPSRFVYDEPKDQCICPRGESLKFERIKKYAQRGSSVRLYRCKSFAQCPVRWQCSQDQHGRTIEITPNHAALTRQRDKQKEPSSQELLKYRSRIVERIFGWIKQEMGFRRWTVVHLSAVRAQWTLLTTTLNLRTLYRYWLTGQLKLRTV